MVRFTLFCFFLGLIQVMALDSYSQQTRISLNQHNQRLEDVLKTIEDKSEFFFLYNRDLINVDQSVNINAKDQTIKEILEELLKRTDISYSIINRQIILSNLEGNSGLVTQQQKFISGKVTDSSGSSLPGVSVVVKGTTTGVITDMNGKYSISKVPENATLQFSFVGLKTQEISVGNKSTINVTLDEETVGVEEVVVVGYGTQKKVNLTGSVDVVSSKALESRSAANVGQLLQGTSPNLNISITNQGGRPGTTPTFNIRGIGSINGKDSPLILVDGVESDINIVDPESIESISVLKDASASAIYGSRAPFGVVLVSTKKGKKNQPIRVQYTDNISLASPIGVPHFVDALTWVTAYNKVSENTGVAPVYPAEQVQRVKDYIAGTYRSEYDPNNPPNSLWKGRWWGNANYDWPSLYWKKVAISQKHNVNLEGGGDKTQFFISSGYYNQGGLNSWGDDGYKRYNVIANVTSQVTDWLRFDYSSKYARTDTDQPLPMEESSREYLYRAMLTFSPMMPYHNINGSLYNPLIAFLQGTGREISRQNDLGITLGTEIEPVKGWKTNVSYNYRNNNSVNTQNPKPVMVELSNGNTGNIGYSTSGYAENLDVYNYTMFNARTSYEKTVGDNYFMAMIGYEQEQAFYRGLYGSRMDLITEEVPSISTALGTSTVDDAISHWATQGIFGRLNYNYKEKYLLEFSARYNGSSRFSKDSRWGFFPSASVGYNIAKENFWGPLLPYVNTLKLRGSYGSLGNQNVANYLYLSTVPIGSELPYIIGNQRPLYARVPGIISGDLTWETITTTDLGIDAGFLNNRLNLVFDWYDRITNNMFGPAQDLPAVLGTGAPFSNNAKLSTKGYEVSIAWNDRVSNDFSYDVKIMIGYNKSKILKYKNDNMTIDGWYEGKTIGEIWGFTTDKIIQTVGEEMPDQSKYYNTWGPGDIKYKDLDGNKIINDGTRTLADHGDLSVIGNSIPRYTIGISAGAKWKGFDVNIFLQGVGKRDYLPSGSSNLFFGLVPGGSNGSESTLLKNGPGLDFWRSTDDTSILGPNTDAYFAKPYWSSENNKNRLPQSRYVLNAAYLRMKNLQIGYTVPQKLSMKVHLYKARIYFSGENLLTLTKLPKTLDPETAIASDSSLGGTEFAGAVYPISRNISFGINLTF